jgi:uncharacterized protein (DUF1778 family)
VQLYRNLSKNKRLSIKLDDRTYDALRRAAGSARKTLALFVRDAVARALRETEYERIRLAYEKQPDSEADADEWLTAEEFRSDPA